MALRRPAAHLQRAPGWRRSVDESCWESCASEAEPLPHPPAPPHTRRRQSAIEGRQVDSWLEHQQVMHRVRSPAHDHSPGLAARATSMDTLQQTGRTWRQRTTPSSSRRSSLCRTPSLCQSSFSSQESLQTSHYSPWVRRGSCETVHITQTPKKEHAQLSCLTPVKVGWLPIEKKVMMVADTCKPKQVLDHSANQVKLKQPITPTFLQNRVRAKAQGGEIERSHTDSSAAGVKTFQTNDRGTAQVAANGGSRPAGWQTLRKGWNSVRESAFRGSTRATEPPTDADGKPPRTKAASVEALKYSPLHGITYGDPCRSHAPLQGTSSTETFKSLNASLQRTSSVQPLKATAPLQIHTNSAATTLIPQNKAGFSSITISSKKVSRSSSLPGSDGHDHFHTPPSSALFHPAMDPNCRQTQRKATIVKVTEQRVTSSPTLSTQTANPPLHVNDLDTGPHRKKATIIKVTEHRESYSPAMTWQPERRHSYTEGVYANDQGNRSPPNTDEKNEKNGPTLHRSTLNLFVGPPSAEAAPVASEIPPKTVGRGSDRPHRPLSCYGNVFGHTEPSRENVSQPPARKWSSGLPQETVNSIIPRTAGQWERRQPAEDVTRRWSSCLTLISAPDPDSRQTPEEVLALNAAAVIANIKLQRQLSKKQTPNGSSAKDGTSTLQGNTATDTPVTPQPDRVPVRRHIAPRAEFVRLSPDPERSAEKVSLQEALQRSKPGFIRRSQGRVQELERRAQERREKAGSVQSGARQTQRRAQHVQPASLRDNLVKGRDGVISGKKQRFGSGRNLAEAKRRKDEEKKREACLTNRQRLELFKKKLLDQILQRNSSSGQNHKH